MSDGLGGGGIGGMGGKGDGLHLLLWFGYGAVGVWKVIRDRNRDRDRDPWGWGKGVVGYDSLHFFSRVRHGDFMLFVHVSRC